MVGMYDLGRKKGGFVILGNHEWRFEQREWFVVRSIW
jgi:hypothetical protein